MKNIVFLLIVFVAILFVICWKHDETIIKKKPVVELKKPVEIQKGVTEHKSDVVNQDGLKKLSDSLFKLNNKYRNALQKIDRLTLVKQTASTDTLFVPFDVPSTCDSVSFSYNTDSIELSGIVLKNGINFKRIHLEDSVMTRFLQTGNVFTVQIKHTNPMFKDELSQTFNVHHEISKWDKIKPAVFFIVGSLLTYKLTK